MEVCHATGAVEIRAGIPRAERVAWRRRGKQNQAESALTAANGDELYTSFTRSGKPAPPTITFTEIHTITGGSGRFANASGTFTVVQTRGLSMPYNNSATIDGTINLGH